MTVRVSIVGGGVNKSVKYPDGSNTEAVEKKLLVRFGQGGLEQHGVGVLSETLAPGEYEYHLTTQQVPAPETFYCHASVKLKRAYLVLNNLRSFDDLVSEIQRKWPAFKFIAFEISYRVDSAAATEQAEVITGDSQLKRFHAQTVKFNVKSRCVGFSDFAKNKAAGLEVAGVSMSDHTLILKDDNVFPVCGAERVSEAAKEVQKELLRRARSICLHEASKYTKREFISPLLIAAICVCNVESRLISMICEKTVVGKRGRGPIDYALLYNRIFVLLTEAKNTDLEGGQVQNIVQQESSRESLANAFVPSSLVGGNRKRKFDEVFDVVRTVPTFGIVTTGGLWRFTKVDHSKQATIVTKSTTYKLILDPDSELEKAVQLSNIETILKVIVGVLQYQMQVVNESGVLQTLLNTKDSDSVERLEEQCVALVHDLERENEDKVEGNDDDDDDDDDIN